jgi:hypothetical protein
MIQYVSGQECPVICGDPDSVLRLGPVSAIERDRWTVQKANTIAQFLEMVERILASKWFHTPKSMTSSSHKDKQELLEAIFPNDEDVMAVLTYFRQLYGDDELVSRVCGIYLKHSGDGRKKDWILERQQTFESLVTSPPAFFKGNGETRLEIIRMFMYGARLLHSSSRHGQTAALQAFITQHQRHASVIIFNACLMDLFGVASTIYPVVKQDFSHWIGSDALAPPDRIAIPALFANIVAGRTQK